MATVYQIKLEVTSLDVALTEQQVRKAVELAISLSKTRSLNNPSIKRPTFSGVEILEVETKA